MRMILTALFACFLLACGDGAPTKTETTNPEPVVTQSEAISIAQGYVLKNKAFFSEVDRFDAKPVNNLNNKLRSYEVSLYRGDKPAGYVNVPVYEGFGVVSLFFQSGRAPSVELENIKLKLFEDEGGQVLERKLVGGVGGAYGVAVKTQKPISVIGDGLAYLSGIIYPAGEYYIYTRQLGGSVPSSAKGKDAPNKDLVESLTTDNMQHLENAARLQEERAFRQSLIQASATG